MCVVVVCFLIRGPAKANGGENAREAQEVGRWRWWVVEHLIKKMNIQEVPLCPQMHEIQMLFLHMEMKKPHRLWAVFGEGHKRHINKESLSYSF